MSDILIPIQSPLPAELEEQRTALVKSILEIQAEYREKVRPFLERLVKIEASRPPPRFYFNPNSEVRP